MTNNTIRLSYKLKGNLNVGWWKSEAPSHWKNHNKTRFHALIKSLLPLTWEWRGNGARCICELNDSLNGGKTCTTALLVAVKARDPYQGNGTLFSSGWGHITLTERGVNWFQMGRRKGKVKSERNKGYWQVTKPCRCLPKKQAALALCTL